MPANIPHGHVGEAQCEQHPLETINSDLIGVILTHGPMTHEQMVVMFPGGNVDNIHATINKLIEDGTFFLEGDLIKIKQ